MKKWQIATLAAAVALTAAGAVGTSLRGAPQASDPNIVILPSTVVVANPAPPDAPPPQKHVWPAAPALPAAPGPVLYATDFTANYNAAAWHSPAFVSDDSAALWLVNDQGLLYQAGNQYLEQPLEESVYITGDKAWSDMTLEASLLATSQEGAGLVWRVQPGDRSFYRVQLYAALPNTPYTARLERVTNGKPVVLAQVGPDRYPGYTPDAWQSLRVTSSGDRQQVTVNGSALFDVRDSAFGSGPVGLFAWADSGTHFDNLRVSSATASR